MANLIRKDAVTKRAPIINGNKAPSNILTITNIFGSNTPSLKKSKFDGGIVEGDILTPARLMISKVQYQ